MGTAAASEPQEKADKVPKTLRCGCGRCKVKVVGDYQRGSVRGSSQRLEWSCRCQSAPKCFRCGRCREHDRCGDFVAMV